MGHLYDFEVDWNGVLNWHNLDTLEYADTHLLCEEGTLGGTSPTTALDTAVDLAERWIVSHFAIPASRLRWARRLDGTARCRAYAGTPEPTEREIQLQAENDHLREEILRVRKKYDPACCSNCGGKFSVNGGGTGGICGFCMDAQLRAADRRRADKISDELGIRKATE
jgi:hypothetical protein